MLLLYSYCSFKMSDTTNTNAFNQGYETFTIILVEKECVIDTMNLSDKAYEKAYNEAKIEAFKAGFKVAYKAGYEKSEDIFNKECEDKFEEECQIMDASLVASNAASLAASKAAFKNAFTASMIPPWMITVPKMPTKAPSMTAENMIKATVVANAMKKNGTTSASTSEYTKYWIPHWIQLEVAASTSTSL